MEGTAAKLEKDFTTDFAEVATVLVGEGKVKFVVHPGVICASSPYFEAEIKRWKQEGEPIHLEYDDPATFELYLEVVYAFDRGKVKTESLVSIIRLYVLADMLGDLTTANTAVDQVERFVIHDPTSTCLGDLHAVTEAWHTTPPNSPLRWLLVDTYILPQNEKLLYDLLEEEMVPRDFAVTVAQLLAKEVTAMRKDRRDGVCRVNCDFGSGCKYHQHIESAAFATLPQVNMDARLAR